MVWTGFQFVVGGVLAVVVICLGMLFALLLAAFCLSAYKQSRHIRIWGYVDRYEVGSRVIARWWPKLREPA